MIYLLTTSLLETQTLRHLWGFLFECDDNYSVFGYGYEHGRHSGARRRRLMWARHKTWILALTSLTTLHISFILSVVASHWSRVITWPQYWPLIGREEDHPGSGSGLWILRGWAGPVDTCPGPRTRNVSCLQWSISIWPESVLQTGSHAHTLQRVQKETWRGEEVSCPDLSDLSTFSLNPSFSVSLVSKDRMDCAESHLNGIYR